MTIDYLADLREARHRLLAELDTAARVSVRPVICRACSRPLVPLSGERECRCPEPCVVTVDDLVASLCAAVDRLTVDLAAARAEADGASARAELAEASARLVTEALAGFYAKACEALGVPGQGGGLAIGSRT